MSFRQRIVRETTASFQPPDDTRPGRTWLCVWEVPDDDPDATRMRLKTRTVLVVVPQAVALLAPGADLILVWPKDALLAGLDIDDLTMQVLEERELGHFVTRLSRDAMRLSARQRAVPSPHCTN